MVTRNPVGGYFDSEFPATFNHRGVIATRIRKTLIFRKIFAFFEKRPLSIKFSIFCFESFIATLIDVLCSNFVKFGRWEIGEIVRCLPEKKKTKFRLPLYSLLRGWRPKSASIVTCTVSDIKTMS